MIENSVSDQVRCFAVGEVTDILQDDATITVGEVSFESL
jgi:hypothetical protein